MKEEKNKVGRPKLADNEVLKTAKVSILVSLLLCFAFSFYLFCYIKGENPLKYAYHLSLEKVFGVIENKNGFLVNYKYDNNYDYVMEFKVPSSVSNYSGSYKYTLYEMNGDTWKKVKNVELDRSTKSFKVKVKSLKNQNKTWKITLQIVNASKIDKSYAPAGWTFVDAKDNADMYAYKLFTVKGYYSPVSLSEVREAKKNKDKVTVSTDKSDPRSFIVSLPSGKTFDVRIKYTDVNQKDIILADDKNVTNKLTYKVPVLNKVSYVTINVYNPDVEDLKLSNWSLKTDNKGNKYITNRYPLKPSKAY